MKDFYPYYSVFWKRFIPEEGDEISVLDESGRLVSSPFEFRKSILYPVDWWGLKFIYDDLYLMMPN